MTFPIPLPSLSPKNMILIGALVAIVASSYFSYKYIVEKQKRYEARIVELEQIKAANQQNIATLEKLLEEETKKEKIKEVYVDRVKKVYIEVEKKREEVKNAPASELNSKFKEAMTCFEESC